MRSASEPEQRRVRLVGAVPGLLERGDPAEVLARLRALEPCAVLARSRTTETSLVDLPGRGPVVRKRWWFPAPRDRWRGVFRTTLLARSPAAREHTAMRGGGPTGFHPPALAALEARRFGLLHECLLLVTYVPDASDLAQFLVAAASRRVRRGVLDDLARRVRRLHDSGLADGEMHPRNVLVAAGRTFKVDCARQRRFRGGAPRRRRAHDLASLDVGLFRLASRTERLRALRTYLGDGAPRSDLRRFATRIENLRTRLAPREERRLPGPA